MRFSRFSSPSGCPIKTNKRWKIYIKVNDDMHRVVFSSVLQKSLKISGSSRNRTGDRRICNPMLYRWAILPGCKPADAHQKRYIVLFWRTVIKKWKNCRHLPDSNRRGRSPVDFESTALTTRPRCRQYQDRGILYNKKNIRNDYSKM